MYLGEHSHNAMPWDHCDWQTGYGRGELSKVLSTLGNHFRQGAGIAKSGETLGCSFLMEIAQCEDGLAISV